MTHYEFTSNDVLENDKRVVYALEYRDGAGNTIVVNEADDEDIIPESEEVQAYLSGWGYDGPNDWELA